jgi:hypothetical protein
LKPSMGPILDLMPRWSCSSRLFRYFEDRSFVLLGQFVSLLHLPNGTMRARIGSEADLMARMTLMTDRFVEQRLGCGHIPPVA